MFLENEFARPLFDFVKGGPPKAFQCLVLVRIPELFGLHSCGRVTRTERGMRMHLKKVHDWEEQPCLYSTERLSVQNPGAPRKLRAGAPVFPKESGSKITDLETKPRKSPEMKEGDLLKLMKEEK